MVTYSFSREFKGKTYTFSKLKNGSLSIKEGNRLVANLSDTGFKWGGKVDKIVMAYIIKLVGKK